MDLKRRAGSRGRTKHVYPLDCCEEKVSGVRGTFTFKALRSLYEIRSGLLRHSDFKWLYPPTGSRSHVRTGTTTDLYSLCNKPDGAAHQILSIKTTAAGRWKGYDHRLTMLCLPDFLAVSNKSQMIHLEKNTRQLDKVSLQKLFIFFKIYLPYILFSYHESILLPCNWSYFFLLSVINDLYFLKWFWAGSSPVVWTFKDVEKCKSVFEVRLLSAHFSETEGLKTRLTWSCCGLLNTIIFSLQVWRYTKSIIHIPLFPVRISDIWFGTPAVNREFWDLGKRGKKRMCVLWLRWQLQQVSPTRIS